MLTLIPMWPLVRPLAFLEHLCCCSARLHKLVYLRQERVNLARKIEKMEFFHSREQQHNSWVRQASEAMEIDVDDDLLMGTCFMAFEVSWAVYTVWPFTPWPLVCSLQEAVKVRMRTGSSRGWWKAWRSSWSTWSLSRSSETRWRPSTRHRWVNYTCLSCPSPQRTRRWPAWAAADRPPHSSGDTKSPAGPFVRKEEMDCYQRNGHLKHLNTFRKQAVNNTALQWWSETTPCLKTVYGTRLMDVTSVFYV